MSSNSNFMKIMKITYVEGYRVTFLFSNQKKGTFDVKEFFSKHALSSGMEKELFQNYERFLHMKVEDGTITWPEVGLHSPDIAGNPVFHPLDLDPEVVYRNAREICKA